MSRNIKLILATGVISACALLVACQNSGSSKAAQAATASGQPSASTVNANPVPITVPDGTHLVVRIDKNLGSSVSNSGETFHASIAHSIVENGHVVIPRGADVTGRVVMAQPSGHLKTPAELAVELTSVSVDGESYPLATHERAWRGRSHKKHDAKWIAGLAGGGALIGALVGHGTGALVGVGVGAGAGTVTAYATGQKNIYLPSETELGFILRQPLTIYRAG